MIAGNSNQTISAASAVKIQVNPSQRCFFVNEVASQIKILVVNANAPTYPIQPSAISTMRCKKLSKLSKLLDFELLIAFWISLAAKTVLGEKSSRVAVAVTFSLSALILMAFTPFPLFGIKFKSLTILG